jgi:hypothetical protein
MSADKQNEDTAIQACIDRMVPEEFAAEAAYVAALENPENEVQSDDKLALMRAKKWFPGRTLRVRFLDGTDTMKDKVAKYAKIWCEHANIRFDFGNYKNAHIRISFFADRGSWSALGTDALVRSWFPLNQPTMNYGWLRDHTSDDEYSRVVLHEFGHALAAIHEHQNPIGDPIVWNKEAVYDYFSGAPNFWDKDAIDHNILNTYSMDQLQGTDYDGDSIMLYGFPGTLMANGKGTKSNSVLSAKDIEAIRKAYPRP